MGGRWGVEGEGLGFSAAFFVFLAAATGAGVVAADGGGGGGGLFAGFVGEHSHDVGGGAVVAEEVGHDLHVRVDVVEEALVGGAEVVEALFAGGGADEAVLGALAVAGEADLAVA